MEKPPKHKRDSWITRAQARDKWFPLSMLGVAIGGYIAREGSLFAYSGGILDSAMLIAMTALVAWLLWPKSVKPDAE